MAEKVIHDIILGRKRSDGGFGDRITVVEGKYVTDEWYNEVSAGTGIIAPPTGAEFVMDSWPDGVDAVVSTISPGSLPDIEHAREADGTIVTTTLDAAGNYVLSGVPAVVPAAIISRYRVPFKDYDYTKSLNAFKLEDQDLNHIVFDTNPSNVPTRGGVVAFNPAQYALDFHSGLGPVAQIPYEQWKFIYNETGVEIDNGKPVYPVGGFGGHPSVALSIADTHEKITRPIYMTTMAIPADDGAGGPGFGIATKDGIVRGLDTTGLILGQEVYLSPTVLGGLQSERPAFPDYQVRIGGVTKPSSGPGIFDGEITVAIGGTVADTFNNFFNGIFRESIDFLITSTGGVITGSLSPSNGHPDMTMCFSDGFTMLTTTPDDTIVLTAGTDTNPQHNFIYIPKSTKVLTLSTSDWPTAEHIKVANVVLKSATDTEDNGALSNRNWNDHVESTTTYQGHLSHITERMRQMAAHWETGVEGSVTIVGTSDPDDVFLAVTSGVAYQLHRQVFDALDMQTGDHAVVVNNFATPYLDITNFNTQTLDALGNTLVSKYFTIVLWGVQNKTGEASHLMINLPNGSYNSASGAIADAAGYTDHTIPHNFVGNGFLIARFTFGLSPAGSGTWTLEDTFDLRGFVPNSTAGGGGGGGSGVSTFLGLLDTPSAYTGKALQAVRVNAGETDLEFSADYALGNYTETLKAATTSANVTIDLADGTVQRWILDAARQFTMPADPGAFGKSFVLILEPATFAVTWGATPVIEWLTSDGAAPTLVTAANLVNVLTFIWDDVDSRWLGFLGGIETA